MTFKRQGLFALLSPQLFLLLLSISWLLLLLSFSLFLLGGPIQAAEGPRRPETFFRYDRQIPLSFSGAQAGKPTCIAIDSTGRLFMTCSLTNEIRVFDTAGRLLLAFGRKSSHQDQTKGSLSEPSGIAIDKGDRIYVSDLAMDKILVYNPDGVFQSQFSIHQPKPEEKGRDACAPFIACNPSDKQLYIPDACNHLVGVYTQGGKFKTSFGSQGLEDGQLSGPAHVAFDSKGNIYVVDAGNFRVQSFTPGFKFRFAFGKSGTKEGEFIRAYDIAIDDKDRIYVSDFILNSVQVFNQKGEYLDSLRRTDNNSHTFSQPLGLAYASNKIYVVNAETRVVSVFDVSR